jgi:hypothetical protein
MARRLFALASIVLAAVLSCQVQAWGEEVTGAAEAQFTDTIAPLIETHCAACHMGEEPTGGLAFDELVKKLNFASDRQHWDNISQKLHSGQMPPAGEEPLADGARAKLTGWIDAELAKTACGDGPRDPGRVTIRRLNRNEYNNTIRDLLGVDFRPADDFPSDDVGYGFDNIGDVLSMPPILLEKYLTAAENISSRVLGGRQVNLLTQEITGGESIDNETRIITNESVEVRAPLRMHGKAQYLFRIRAWGDQAGDEPVRMAVYLDKELIREFEVKAADGKPDTYEAWFDGKGGKRTVSIRFLNDFYDDKVDPPLDRNLYLRDLEVTGPYPDTVKRLLAKEYTPETRLTAAREILHDLMWRAYRRPVQDAELDRVMKLVELADHDGESFGAAVGLGLQAILCSPNFLFRVELDPQPGEPEIRRLNDFEVATRLSYFLWSSMPDDELFELAKAGVLRTDGNLEKQVRRMLADEKADALVESFAGQWLQLRNLKVIAPDREKYPAFDEQLRRSMQRETELFFAEIMHEDRSVLEFLNADYTFVDERLASHYGLSDVKGDEFRKVALDSAQRGGVLTQASVLTVTSNPTRTSPVKRGKWILENLFGTPPPPPPPDVPELEEAGAAVTGTLRERMEQHRANPNCAVCHNRMDPLGFGLENFDGVGGWRQMDGPHEIDASGELPGGEKFSGPGELKQILLARKDDFVRCLAEKLLTYALGRGIEYSDRCTVEDIALATQKQDYRFSSLVLAIVESDAFQKRRALRSEP